MKTLIVEDEPTTRLLLSAIAASSGFDPTACESAEAAWEVYQKDTFPLVILDWMLEGTMDGVQLCRNIRKSPLGDRSYILMITSRNRTEDLQAVLEAGADDYLAKPIDVGLLEVRLTIAGRQVEQLIARKEAEAALAQTAGKIQQSVLLGQIPSDMANIQIGALTIPSQEVDGDFYDFIKHNDWNLDLIVCDVMGKGIPAALLGAAIKSQFLRAISHLVSTSESWKLPLPDKIVSVVHDEMAEQLIRLESFATFCYARINLEHHRMEFVDCGHTKTIHYNSGTKRCSLLQGENMPLGFIEKADYELFSISIEPNDILCFYSDGVTETKNDEGELFGEERLADIISDNSTLTPNEILARIQEHVVTFSGRQRFKDDLTCVIVRINDAGDMAPTAHGELTISSNLSDLVILRSFIHRFCQEHVRGKLSEEDIMMIELAVHETASNVMRHAYDNRPDEDIEIETDIFPNRLTIRLYHSGKTFDPEKVPPPSFDGSRDGGFGLYIISECMDEVKYLIDDRGKNCILLEKSTGNVASDIHSNLFHVEQARGVTVLRLSIDSVDASNAIDFRKRIGQLIPNYTHVVLDMETVQFIDSSGLGVILSCLRELNELGGDLKLAVLSKKVRSLFSLVRMDRIFEIFPTVSDAVDAYINRNI